MSTPSHYIHGTDPEEQQRLTLLNTVLLNEACLKELNLKGGEQVLDVGSGLGQFSRAMARAAGTRVVGIERSEEQLAQAVRQAKDDGEEELVEFRAGDARQLPLREAEWGTFDVAHTRFVLEHVPDPLNVVKQMVRAVKPGGRVMLADDDHDVLRMYPEVSGFKELWDAYMQTYRELGNDPFIGRKLPALLNEGGAKQVRTTWVFFGACHGHPHFDVYVDNLIKVVEGARDQILKEGLFNASSFDEVIDSFKQWRRAAGAALWYSVCWAEGRRVD